MVDRLKAKKSFGQHFLADRSVVKKIIAAAELAPGDVVLEIGPGTGVLTQALIASGATVIAVEADRDLIPGLRERFGDKITLIEGDILSLPNTVIASPGGAKQSRRDRFGLRPRDDKYKLVANLPYNITSAVLHKFLTEDPRPSRMVVMVQREVADRILAVPPDMSLLSVVCQLYARCKKVTNVPRGAFRPMPKVDSAVVRLDLVKNSQPLALERVIAVAKVGFSSRRKQLHGNLAQAGFGSSEDIKKTLLEIGQNPLARAENLTVEDWKSLSLSLRGGYEADEARPIRPTAGRTIP